MMLNWYKKGLKMKVTLLSVLLICGVSMYAHPSIEDRGKLIACSVAVATARQELPWFLRWGIKPAEPMNGTAQELQAALAYQKQNIAQARDEHEKKAQTMILENLQRMVVE
jgi:hypothetical protein